MAMGGFGDFGPMNFEEQYAAIALVVVNYCLLLYVIGVMTNIVTQVSVKTRAFRKEFSRLQSYLDAHALPDDIANELKLFLKLKFQRRNEHAEVAEAFPPLFRARLFRLMYRPVVEKSFLLRDATDTFLDLLSCELVVHLFQTVRE